MSLMEILQKRCSVRKYTGEPISDENITKVLQAGLLSASGRGIKPWEMIVVKNKDTLKKMSECRVGSAKMLDGADAAIVVIANTDLSDVWIEDCSIVMANMYLMADDLGLGSCWIQCRLREASDGRTTEDYLREIFEYPVNYRVEAIMSLGMPESHKPIRELSEFSMSKIHYEKY